MVNLRPQSVPGHAPINTRWEEELPEQGPVFRYPVGFPADVQIGDRTQIVMPNNIYGCKIGTDCRIGPFVEIQRGVVIGNFVKIGSHAFLCAGVVVEDKVFIGHGVMTCNDRWPRATLNGRLKGPEDWTCEGIIIRRGASIGTGAVLLPGIEIGAGAMVAAGAVVTRNVPAFRIVRSNPARQVPGFTRDKI